jgi:hypothetical protein
MGNTLQLKAGEALTITAGVASTGTVRRVENPGGGVSYNAADIAAGATVIVGPFYTNRVYEIITTAGAPLTHSIAIAEEGHAITSGIVSVSTTINAAQALTVPDGSQAVIYDTLTVNGTVTVLGTLAVLGWPS